MNVCDCPVVSALTLPLTRRESQIHDEKCDKFESHGCSHSDDTQRLCVPAHSSDQPFRCSSACVEAPAAPRQDLQDIPPVATDPAAPAFGPAVEKLTGPSSYGLSTSGADEVRSKPMPLPSQETAPQTATATVPQPQLCQLSSVPSAAPQVSQSLAALLTALSLHLECNASTLTGTTIVSGIDMTQMAFNGHGFKGYLP